MKRAPHGGGRPLEMRFEILHDKVDVSLPLIYMWEIHDQKGALLGCYVGKARAGAKRPREHYSRNVANILSERSYRKSNPRGYRRIHYALADAECYNHMVTLHLLCNVSPHENINAVEHRCIDCLNSSGSEKWQLND